MAQVQLAECLNLEGGKLERVHYFPRQLLTADDLTADSEYFRMKMRRHNRHLHGWGAVCGLGVSPAPTAELPWRVRIGDGYALGPGGDEIYVGESIFLDLALCGPGAATDPCAPSQLRTLGSAVGGAIFVAIKYAECLARPVRVMPAGCACEDEACDYSRIRDSFQIECLTELPPSHQQLPGPSLCDLIKLKHLPLCPPCPAEPWVVLAEVTLPASPSETIADNKIDNFTFRRQVFSTAVLQEQLIKCCCEAVTQSPEPARVTSIDPTDDAVFEITGPPHVLITFDKKLSASTVNAKTIQVMMFPDITESKPIAGVVTYDETTSSAVFKPDRPFPGGTDQSVRYEVTARGDAPDPILDSDGLALDGDKNGSPGGNFKSTFKIVPRLLSKKRGARKAGRDSKRNPKRASTRQ